MAKYRHVGEFEANVSLPDLSVILVQPGEVVDLPFDDPGPAWEPVRRRTKDDERTPTA